MQIQNIFRCRPILRLFLPILAVAVAFSSCMMCGIFARYVKDWVQEEKPIAAAEMFVGSDILTEAGSAYTLRCESIADASINFILYNYTDEYHISTAPVDYTVTCKQGDTVVGTPITGSIASGAQNAANISVPLTEAANDPTVFDENTTVVVTVDFTAPYLMTLQGTFYVNEVAGTLEHTVTDAAGNTAGTVTITNKHVIAKTVTVTVPEGCYVDPTSLAAGMTVSNNDRTLTFVANADGEYQFAFLKATPSGVYTAADFTVTGA